MKKTFEERMKSKIHQAKKKKLFMRFFRIAYYKFLLLFYYIGLFFSWNAKRFIIALAALMIFCLSSSFVEMSRNVGTSYAYALPQNGEKPDSDLELVVEEQIKVDTIIEDDDVIDGYEKEQFRLCPARNLHIISRRESVLAAQLIYQSTVVHAPASLSFRLPLSP